MNEKTEGGGWKVPPPQLYFNPFQIQSWLTLLVLGPIFVDGCIRRSMSPPQATTTTTTTTTTTPPTTTTGTTTAAAAGPMSSTFSIVEETTSVPSHIHACLPDEVQRTNCLHGGTCYVVIVSNHRQSFCHCTEEWTGKRCEQYFIDPGILATMEQHMRTANIAAGVSVCILVLFVLLFASYVYIRKRQRKKRLQLSLSDDPEALTSLEPNGRHVSQGADDPDRTPEFDLNRNDRLPRDETCRQESRKKSTSL